jgi:hypothetical protein
MKKTNPRHAPRLLVVDLKALAAVTGGCQHKEAPILPPPDKK